MLCWPASLCLHWSLWLPFHQSGSSNGYLRLTSLKRLTSTSFTSLLNLGVSVKRWEWGWVHLCVRVCVYRGNHLDFIPFHHPPSLLVCCHSSIGRIQTFASKSGMRACGVSGTSTDQYGRSMQDFSHDSCLWNWPSRWSSLEKALVL